MKKKLSGTLAIFITISIYADTTGGSSGLSIILESSQEIIGIHSQAGCTSSGGANQGTLIAKHNQLVAAIRNCLNSERMYGTKR